MNSNVKKCLFGGALVGAGLCSSAAAGTVDWSFDSMVVPFAYTTTGGVQYANPMSSSWDLSSYGLPDHAAYNIAGTFGLDMGASANSGNAIVETLATFTVSENMMMTLDWNLGTGDTLTIVDLDTNAYLVDIFASTDSDAVDHLFVANRTYAIFVTLIRVGDGSSSFHFFENNMAVVPVPTAAFAGLGMLAGLGAYRRVRR